MGCTNSVPDPNLMYSQSKEKQLNNNNNKNRIYPEKKDVTKNEANFNVHNNKQIKGDLFTYNLVRLSRQKTMHLKLEEREKLAQEISARMLDEREQLSLSTTRSRTTSKAVSPRSTAQVGFSSFSSVNTTQTTQDQDLSELPPTKEVESSSGSHVRKSASDDCSSSTASHTADVESGHAQRCNVKEASSSSQKNEPISTNNSTVLQSHDQEAANGMSAVESDSAAVPVEEGAKKSKRHRFKKEKKTKAESNVSDRNDMISYG